jgi:hypothetical protein
VVDNLLIQEKVKLFTEPVVRRFVRHHDIMRVALGHTSIDDPDEPGSCMHLANHLRPRVTHRGHEAIVRINLPMIDLNNKIFTLNRIDWKNIARNWESTMGDNLNKDERRGVDWIDPRPLPVKGHLFPGTVFHHKRGNVYSVRDRRTGAAETVR